jgi:DNA polymerase III subunit epsilon
MNFVAIDVETANPSLASICQIGLVRVDHGKVKEKWTTLVNPQEPFHDVNICIHGITPEMTETAPTFPLLMPILHDWLSCSSVVCHTAFDRNAINRVSRKYSLPEIPCRWLDTARVARRTWPDCAWGGYGLHRLAEKLGISYCEHDAGEDARACAEVLLHAERETGFSLDEWFERVNWGIRHCHSGLDCPPPEHPRDIHLEGNPDGELYGNVIVFTGVLSMTREEAARRAAEAGCHVDDSVTKHTTLLVVGCQDIARLAGHDKSSKHRKAEDLIARGQRIRILAESDFRLLVEMS